MKFVVSSSDLLSHLQAISKVINPKNSLPILDNFLFNIKENNLEITASDLETTLITNIELDNVENDGSVAMPAKILIDTLRELPEQPLTFEIDMEMLSIDIYSENGKFSVVGQPGDEYPQNPDLQEDKTSIIAPAELIQNGIDKTLFATADDELRPVMNGIYVQLANDNITFVASDSHKLVRYRRYDLQPQLENSFILPKKPANLLKNILAKEPENVTLEFDNKNAQFVLNDYRMICRLVEGDFPNYEAVIPHDNWRKMKIDRVDLLTSMKRVSVFSNQASNLVKLEINGNQVTVSAQDIDFSISAFERLNCELQGDPIEIGFKSLFFMDIVNNLDSVDVSVEMSEPDKACLVFPVDKQNEQEDILMLIMPMMLNV